jgi:hypothetical protein
MAVEDIWMICGRCKGDGVFDAEESGGATPVACGNCNETGYILWGHINQDPEEPFPPV